jgi:hypothetical protein
MAYARVGTAQVTGSAGTFTTAAIDTTGADLITISGGYFTTPVVSDSKSNTWLSTNEETGSGNPKSRIYYAYNAIVGTGHTFTITQGSFIGTIVVQAYSGSLTSGDPLDNQSEGNAVGRQINLPDVTPSVNDCLIATTYCNDFVDAAGLTVDGGFTIRGSGSHIGGTAFGVGFADLIQTTAAAVGPTWDDTNGGNSTAIQAVFKPAAGGGGSTWPGYQSPYGWRRNKKFPDSFKEKLFREQVKHAPIIGKAA